MGGMLSMAMVSTTSPEVQKAVPNRGSSKFGNTRPGGVRWFTLSFLDCFLVSDSLLTEKPSPVG
jgi:hypothetical protein